MASRLLPLRFPEPWMSAISVVKTHHPLNLTPYDLSCASSLKNPADGASAGFWGVAVSLNLPAQRARGLAVARTWTNT